MAAARRIIVQRIPFTVEFREVRDYFSQFGAVEKCFLYLNKKSGLYSGEGWVRYSKSESASQVLERSDHRLDGYKILVKESELRIHDNAEDK